MAAQEIAEFELRRLSEELAAKEAELGELRGKTSNTLLHLQEENDKLRKWLTSTTEQLREAKATMEAAADRLGSEVDAMAQWLERERAERDEVEERLSRMLADLAVQVELLRGVYRRESATMPPIGLNPYRHRVNFDERRLADLILYFSHLSEELTHLRAALGAALDREGVRAPLPSPHASSPAFITMILSSWWMRFWTSLLPPIAEGC